MKFKEFLAEINKPKIIYKDWIASRVKLPADDDLITRSQAARLAGIDVQILTRAIENKQLIPTTGTLSTGRPKLGQEIKLRWSDVHKWLKQHQEKRVRHLPTLPPEKDVVGVKDIMRLAKVTTTAAVHKWQVKPSFPRPVKTDQIHPGGPGRNPKYKWSEVKAWLEHNFPNVGYRSAQWLTK